MCLRVLCLEGRLEVVDGERVRLGRVDGYACIPSVTCYVCQHAASDDGAFGQVLESMTRTVDAPEEAELVADVAQPVEVGSGLRVPTGQDVVPCEGVVWSRDLVVEVRAMEQGRIDRTDGEVEGERPPGPNLSDGTSDISGRQPIQ
jgi:hypothetical protein